jgi:hypothetical protein
LRKILQQISFIFFGYTPAGWNRVRLRSADEQLVMIALNYNTRRQNRQ